MSISSQNAMQSGAEVRLLERDESRFRYFSPNGKAVIRPDYVKFLTVKTSFELAQQAD